MVTFVGQTAGGRTVWTVVPMLTFALLTLAPNAYGDTNQDAIDRDRAARVSAKATADTANCLAQHRCTPQPTATVVAATFTPAPAPVRALPAPATVTPIPEPTHGPPGLPVPDAQADPQLVYLLGDAVAPDWLVLATVFGRWAVQTGDECASLPLGVDLLIDPLPADGVPEVETLDGLARCRIVAAVWQTSSPCAQNEDGACSAALDPMSPMYAPPADEQTPVVIVVVATAIATPAAAQPRAPPPAAAPASDSSTTRVVEPTVVVTATPVTVVATAVPATRTPVVLPTFTPVPTLGPRPTTTPAAEAVDLDATSEHGSQDEPVPPPDPVEPRWPTWELIGLWLGTRPYQEQQWQPQVS